VKVRLKKPGLFITATDTEVGKTVVTCAMAMALRGAGLRVGACKPIASGCRHEREGLVSEDAEALAYFSDSRLPLTVVNPVRYQEPVAPAVAAELAGEAVDEAAIAAALRQLDEACDVLLIEGIGGIMTPLSPERSLLDLAVDIGYPVVVVSRNRLGTLNHTAMTCRVIREAGLRLAGIIVNQFDPETSDTAEIHNPQWLARQNRAEVLTVVPRVPQVDLTAAKMPPEIFEAVIRVDWLKLCAGQSP
jgi:dethiobiotin synthetase